MSVFNRAGLKLNRLGRSWELLFAEDRGITLVKTPFALNKGLSISGIRHESGVFFGLDGAMQAI